MRRLRKGSAIALAVAAVAAVLGSAVPSADAARRPSPAGAAAIKKVSLDACRTPNRDCRFRYSRVSTRNARYAWAQVVGEGFSGALLKRPSGRSLRFRVIGIQGGGISECSYWRARAPRPVLRDLRIGGLLADSNAVRNCG